MQGKLGLTAPLEAQLDVKCSWVCGLVGLKGTYIYIYIEGLHRVKKGFTLDSDRVSV